MHYFEIEALFERIQLLAKRYRVPVLVAVEQDDWPLVSTIGERSDHAHHRSDADAAGDKYVHVCGVSVDGECAVRPIEVNAQSHRHMANLAGEITKIPDRHLDASIISRSA